MDADLTTGYENLVAKWASFAMYKGADESTRRMRKCGLLALDATIGSPAFFASDAKRQIDIMLPAILTNLAGEDEKEGGLESLIKR